MSKDMIFARYGGLNQLDFMPLASVMKRRDEGIRCSTRQSIKWPNIMTKFGFSEPLPQLCLDAEWWPLQSKGHNSMVIIVLLADMSNSLECEILIETANPPRYTTKYLATIRVVFRFFPSIQPRAKCGGNLLQRL